MKKKHVFALVSIILVFAVLVTAVSFVFYISKYNLGVVTKISVKQKSSDIMELRIKYLFASGGYSVRVVPEDEGEYCGDGLADYDGAIGKYRILVSFGDVKLSDSYYNQMAEDGVIKIKEGVSARVATPSDHGFVLYIGSDKPINAENLENGELNSLGGIIKIQITVGE